MLSFPQWLVGKLIFILALWLLAAVCLMMLCDTSYIKVSSAGNCLFSSSCCAIYPKGGCVMIVGDETNKVGGGNSGDIKKKDVPIVPGDGKKGGSSDLLKLLGSIMFPLCFILCWLDGVFGCLFTFVVIAMDPVDQGGAGGGSWGFLTRVKRWLVSWIWGDVGAHGVQGGVENPPVGQSWWTKVKNFFSSWWNGGGVEGVDAEAPVDDEGGLGSDDENSLIEKFKDMKVSDRANEGTAGKQVAGDKSLANKVANMGPCPAVKHFSEESLPGPSKDSIPVPDKESVPGPSKDSIPVPDKESFPGPSKDSIPVPDKESVPGPSKDSIPVPDKESVPGPSKDSIPVPDKESVPGPSKDSIPVPDKESVPGPSKDSIPVPDKESVPGPSKGSIPVPSKDSIPVPDKESFPGPSKDSIPVSEKESLPGPSKDSIPVPDKESLPGPGDGSSPEPGTVNKSPHLSRAFEDGSKVDWWSFSFEERSILEDEAPALAERLRAASSPALTGTEGAPLSPPAVGPSLESEGAKVGPSADVSPDKKDLSKVPSSVESPSKEDLSNVTIGDIMPNDSKMDLSKSITDLVPENSKSSDSISELVPDKGEVKKSISSTGVGAEGHALDQESPKSVDERVKLLETKEKPKESLSKVEPIRSSKSVMSLVQEKEGVVGGSTNDGASLRESKSESSIKGVKSKKIQDLSKKFESVKE